MSQAYPEGRTIRVPATVYFDKRGDEAEFEVSDVSGWLRTLPKKKLNKLKDNDWDHIGVTKSIGYWLARRGNADCREALREGWRCDGATFAESRISRWFATFGDAPRRKRTESSEQIRQRMKAAWLTRKGLAPAPTEVVFKSEEVGKYMESYELEANNERPLVIVDTLTATKTQLTAAERAKRAWDTRRAKAKALSEMLEAKRAAKRRAKEEKAAKERAAKAEEFKVRFSGVIPLRRPKLIIEDPI